jgi:hypothetical protein
MQPETGRVNRETEASVVVAATGGHPEATRVIRTAAIIS